jgi:hypothetical protein
MTARHGWAIGIDGTQYWFITPEPPLDDLH